MRELASTASEALRALLHENLCGASVTDLDGLLVELAETAFRLSELAVRVDRALGSAVEAGGLRLDREGRQRYCSPEDAVVAARAVLGSARGPAARVGQCFDAARQVTSTIGLLFDEDDDESEGLG